MTDGKIKIYIDKVFDLLGREFPDAKLFLFGSRARDLNLMAADIDIGIEETHKVDLVDFKRVSDRFYIIAKKEIVQWKN